MQDYAQIHREGVKKAWELDDRYSEKNQVLQKAYSAAAAELGYKDNDLKDAQKSAQLARLMFSGKYLGNSDFNNLLSDDPFASVIQSGDDVDKARGFQEMFGVNAEQLAGANGIFSRYGDLTLFNFARYLSSLHEGQVERDVGAFLWSSVYDPEKNWTENFGEYQKVIANDAILAHNGKEVDPGKFASLEDATKLASKSLTGKTTVDDFVNRWGVNLN